MNKIIFRLLFFSVIAFPSLGQQLAKKELSFQEYYLYVVENHPVIKQANNEVLYASSELMQAKGQFDPKLFSDYKRKSLNGTDYYNEWITELKVPVWAGIDFKAGREVNNGSYLPNDFTKGVSTYAGLSVPLGRNFLMDERRNTLEQAKIYQEMGTIKQQKIINKLVLSISKSYWEWYLAYQKLRFINEGLNLAQNRFLFLAEQVKIGEKAGIDSLEAKITLQSREVDYQNALIDFKNSTLLLSNHLWQADTPLEIPESVIPRLDFAPEITDENLLTLVVFAEKKHPEISQLALARKQLTIEEKYRKEQLKPQLNASFYALTTPKYVISDYSIFNSNHKIGLNFEMPLFLRKERGKLEQVRIKQLQNDLDKRQLTREIINDVYVSYNEVKNLGEIIKVQQSATQNQLLLVNAEREKFEIGESNLFLINSRESKLIEMQIKVEELKSKYQKAVAQLIFSAGLSSINL